jgi:hypothetical protein
LHVKLRSNCEKQRQPAQLLPDGTLNGKQSQQQLRDGQGFWQGVQRLKKDALRPESKQEVINQCLGALGHARHPIEWYRGIPIAT